MVAYWKLDESSGDAADALGVENLTNVNTVTYSNVHAIINNGAVFAGGSSQRLRRADDAALSITGDISISFWMYMTSDPQSTGAQAILTKFGNASGFGYEFEIIPGSTTAGAIQAYYASDAAGSTATYGSTGDNTIHLNTLYHVVITMAVATKVITIYINGSSSSVTYGSQAASSIYDNTADFLIGARMYGPDHFFYGTIDEVGLWSRVLTSGEVTSLYNSGAGFSYPFVNSYSQTLSETLSLSDSILRTINRSLPETLSLTDTIAKTKIISSNLTTEVLSLSDTIIRTTTKVLSDTLSLVDSTIRMGARTLVDTLSLTDTFSQFRTLGRTFSETLQLKDWLFINGNLIRNIWSFVSKNISNVWTDVSKNVSNIWNLQNKS